MRGFRRAASIGPAPGEPLGVLVICDSPVARQILASALSKENDFAVTTAFDWRHAEQRLHTANPDVAVLCSDRLWPDDEGARIIHEERIPLVVAALDLQARTHQVPLLDLIVRIREAPKGARRSGATKSRAAQPASRAPAPPLDIPTTPRLVALGASAGGTMALKSILPSFPPRAPAIVIVQHMSEHFTTTFARGLARISSIEVSEAEDGEPIVEGRALIAPGNRHLTVERRGTEYFVALVDGPPVLRHRPSVNVLFRSVAQAAGPNGVGVILTGMGDDGADGLLEMKEVGASTIAQNEATSVVFGMPRAAIVRGGVQLTSPLAQLPDAILTAARYKKRSAW